MPKSYQPIEWSVGEEQFTQVSAAAGQEHKRGSATSVHDRSGTTFFQILSWLAIAAAIGMAVANYLSTTESTSIQNPAPSPPTAPKKELAAEQIAVSVLEEQAIQDILALEVSMALGPQLSKRLNLQSISIDERSFEDSITGKRHGGEVDPAVLGLQRREFLLDIKIAEPLAIVTILVENPNDEQWDFGSYQEKRFYQREGASWRWTDPKDQFLNPPQSIETAELRFEFQKLESEYFLAIADEMEVAQARLLKILAPSYSGKEFRPPEPQQSSNRGGANQDEPKLTFVSVPRDVPGLIGAGALQKIASPLVSKRPTNYSDQEWLSQRIFERLVHLQIRKSVATEVGIGYHRWDQIGAALNGWLQHEVLGRRSPWHAEAAAKFEPSIYTVASQPLSVLFTSDPNGWPSREERMEDYMLAETMIEYAVQTHGIGTIGDLLHGLSIYQTWAALIPAVYGVPVDEFEVGWNEYLRTNPNSGCVSNNCLSQGIPTQGVPTQGVPTQGIPTQSIPTQNFSGRGEESWPKKDKE